jgi:hypothetical protein
MFAFYVLSVVKWFVELADVVRRGRKEEEGGGGVQRQGSEPQPQCACGAVTSLPLTTTYDVNLLSYTACDIPLTYCLLYAGICFSDNATMNEANPSSAIRCPATRSLFYLQPPEYFPTSVPLPFYHHS